MRSPMAIDLPTPVACPDPRSFHTGTRRSPLNAEASVSVRLVSVITSARDWTWAVLTYTGCVNLNFQASNPANPHEIEPNLEFALEAIALNSRQFEKLKSVRC